MSIFDVNAIQVGNSATALNNLVIVPDGAGSVAIQQGVIGGGTNRTIATIESNGILHVPGTVIQVVNSVYNTLVRNSTVTLADTGLSATITPKFANSKILVCVRQKVSLGVSATFTWYEIETLRGATQIQYSNREGSLYSSTVFTHDTYALDIFDSPNTIAAVTYKMRVRLGAVIAGVSVECQHNNSRASTMTLYEIAQ